MPSPAPNPGNVAPKPMAKVHGGLMQRKLPGGRPELELVAVTVTPVASVTTDRHVHRERAMPTTDPRVVQGTASVPLGPRPTRGLEPKQVQHPLHRHESADSVEVDAGHGSSSCGELVEPHSVTRWLGAREDRSVPAQLPMGNGNGPLQSISCSVANQRACGKAGRLAPAPPAPRSSARS
jgi:hypothetical protein